MSQQYASHSLSFFNGYIAISDVRKAISLIINGNNDPADILDLAAAAVQTFFS